jgi:hypothetical protein
MTDSDRPIDVEDIDAIDALINAVAREITSAPADKDSHGGSARIDAERETRERGRGRGAAGAGGGRVCAALAVFVARENRQPAPSPTVQRAPQTTPDVTAGARTGDAPPVAAAAPRAASRTRVVSTLPSAPIRAAAAQPAGPGFEPLTLAPIVLNKVDVSPLVVVMPIEMSTIAIDRIEIPAMP